MTRYHHSQRDVIMEKKEKKSNNQWLHKRLPQVGELSKIDPWWGLVLIVFALILVLLFSKPDPFQRILTYCADGIGVTLFVTIVSFILTMIIGLFAGLGRVSKTKWVYNVTSFYIEIIRGIPLLVQLMVWYFAFPAIVMSLGEKLHIGFMQDYMANPVMMAVIGISVCYGAYMAEIVRAGIQSLPNGQMEAARSLGLSRTQAMRYVILPQAYRSIMPAVGNEFIALLKDSSLVSVVAVSDLTRRGREFYSFSFQPIETWAMVALIYLFMTLVSARFVNIIEKKTSMEK